MKHEYETTSRLEKTLKGINDKREADAFIKEHAEDAKEFHQYLNRIIAERGINIPDLIANCGISKNYVYQILNGRRKNPGRDKIIALCVAAGMNFSETNRGLTIAGAGILYAKDERDVRIAVAINNNVHNVARLNLILDSYGLAPLEI